MGKKRSREEPGLPERPVKHARGSLTDLKEGNFFVVRSKHENVHVTFDSYERCKPYLNSKDASVFAFNTREDAENFAKFSLLDSDADETSTGGGTGALNERTSVDTDRAPAHMKQTEEQDCVGEGAQDTAPSFQIVRLPDVVLGELADQVTVYANGTTSTSRKGAKMGWGVYFSDESPYNDAGIVTGSVSSQRADVKAALEALKIIVKVNMIAPDGVVNLYVNSKHVKSAFQSWMHRWKANGWKNANKGLIKNVDLWQEVDATLMKLEEMRVGLNVMSASRSAESFCAGRMAESAMREEK